jgi:hypothetical protein
VRVNAEVKGKLLKESGYFVLAMTFPGIWRAVEVVAVE